MKTQQGGTHLYCPFCGAVRVCKAIRPSLLGEQSGRHYHFTKHTDINWLRRGRRCLTCRKPFLTAEVDEDFLDELIELRGALAQIKENAEVYQSQSQSAAEALNNLTNSLDVLKALKIYKET